MSKRRNPLNRRWVVQTRVLAEVPEGDRWLETMDLGLGGASCRSEVPLPMGETVPCRIWLPGKGPETSVKVEALILRSELRKDGYRIALRFTRMEKGGRLALRECLKGLPET